MKRRSYWAAAAVVLLAALAAELLVVARREGWMGSPLPASIESIRRELLPPTMTARWVRPLLAPVAADTVVGGVLGRDVLLPLSADASVTPEGPQAAGRLPDPAEALRLSLSEQAVEDSRTLANLARRLSDLRSEIGGSKRPEFTELTWLQAAHEEIWGLTRAGAAAVSDEASGPVVGSDDLGRLIALRADAVLERFDREFDGLIGSYEKGRAVNRTRGRRAAVDLVIANQARRLVAERGLTGQDAAVVEAALTIRLQGFLRGKQELTQRRYRAQVQLAVLETIRSAASGGGREIRPVIEARLVVPEWRLRGAPTDVTLRIKPDATIQGQIDGVHVRPADGAVARVTGSFSGTVDDHGIITAEGVYQVDGRAGVVQSTEQGRIRLSGYPTRVGSYLGSIVFRPVAPLQARERTLLWEEPGAQ